MRNSPVSFAMCEPIYTPKFHSLSDSVHLPNGKFKKFVSKIAVWVLDKFGASNEIEHYEYQQITVDPGTVLQRLDKSIDLFSSYGSAKPKRVLIGGKQFDELMPELHYNHQRPGSPFSFEAEITYSSKQGLYGEQITQFYGLPIEVIPHMDGILPL